MSDEIDYLSKKYNIQRVTDFILRIILHDDEQCIIVFCQDLSFLNSLHDYVVKLFHSRHYNQQTQTKKSLQLMGTNILFFSNINATKDYSGAVVELPVNDNYLDDETRTILKSLAETSTEHSYTYLPIHYNKE